MKILIIEDELKIANLLKKGLEMEKFEVDLAFDGKRGFEMSKKGGYDLIILDLMLPKMDGIEICKQLRSLKIKTPIIMLTARDTAKDRMIGMKAGANDYMLKPFSLEELSRRIDNLLNRKKTRAAGAAKGEISEENKRMSQLHHKILDNAPISMITIDKDGFMTSANKYFHSLSSTKDFRKKNIFSSEFFIRENLVEDYKKLLTDGKEIIKDKCFEKNALGEKYLKIIAVPLRDEKGEIEGALSMAVDNTELIVSKNKLQKLNDNLEKKVEQRTLELDRTNAELNKVLNLKSTFMADVSHELRTAMAIIQCNLELSVRQLEIDSGIKKENNEAYHQILEEISRISIMMTDLSLLANSDSLKQHLEYRQIDLNEKIRNACKALSIIAQEKKVKISFAGETELVMMADEQKLEKLIFNLIKNAIRYNKIGGWINVETEDLGSEVAFSVKDGGIGIETEHLPHVFERFYRADKSRSRSEGGSGLGLSICRWVVDSHGGEIKVESTPSEGSMFSVYLPKNAK